MWVFRMFSHRINNNDQLFMARMENGKLKMGKMFFEAIVWYWGWRIVFGMVDVWCGNFSCCSYFSNTLRYILLLENFFLIFRINLERIIIKFLDEMTQFMFKKKEQNYII